VQSAAGVLEILLVEDDSDTRLPLCEALRTAGHKVTAAAKGAQALALISSSSFDLMICDIRLPQVDGLTLFRFAKEESPTTDVILMTAYAGVAAAVGALKEGAYDYLTKPFDLEELILQIARLDTKRSLQRELKRARLALSESRNAPSAGSSVPAIIGQSPAMTRLLSRIDTIAESDAPVLITGETGCGKELVARTVHERSRRRNKPFIAVSCAAFPEALLEAELFGHERGAFTGAVRRREGRFRAAEGGTLLLDEIAEVPLAAQAKLLRVLQEGTIEPLGSNESIKVDVRIVSATHRDLRQRVAEGRFRDDLFYRLDVLDIHIAPLRERRSDLPILLEHFLQKFRAAGKPLPIMSPGAWAVLSRHQFPGNVREFSHAVEHATVLSGGGEIGIEHLPESIRGEFVEGLPRGTGGRPLGLAKKEFEREYLLRALQLADGKRGKAADLLGICRKSLWEKLRDFRLLDESAEDGVSPGAAAGDTNTGAALDVLNDQE
jgi:two-component system response regulator AtoC